MLQKLNFHLFISLVTHSQDQIFLLLGSKIFDIFLQGNKRSECFFPQFLSNFFPFCKQFWRTVAPIYWKHLRLQCSYDYSKKSIEEIHPLFYKDSKVQLSHSLATTKFKAECSLSFSLVSYSVHFNSFNLPTRALKRLNSLRRLLKYNGASIFCKNPNIQFFFMII